MMPSNCWDAGMPWPIRRVCYPTATSRETQHNPLLRAITFTNTIKASKMVEAHWQKVVDVALEQTDSELQADLLPLAVQHVDGTQNSLDRQRSWPG